MPTIIDEYIKQFGQLIIVIIAPSGTNKTEVANSITTYLNGTHIKQSTYLNDKYNKVEEVGDKKIRIWDDESILWTLFNNTINESIQKEKKPLIISGISFNKNRINFRIDYCIHLSLTKQHLLEKRHEYIEKHKDKPEYNELLNMDEETEKLIMNKIIYPKYLETIDKEIITINRYIKIDDIDLQSIVNTSLESLFKYIERKLYEKRSDLKMVDGQYEYNF